MQKIILIALMSLFGFVANAQYLKRINDSTFQVITDIPAGVIKYSDGTRVQVYTTPKGKLYYYKRSNKTGKMTKRYLKEIN